MASDQVEIVKELLTNFARTQKADRTLTGPDTVWDMSTFSGWLDTPTYNGPEGFDDFFAQWTGPYDEWEMDVREIREVPDGRVLVMIRQRGRLHEADSWVELDYGMVVVVKGGLVAYIECYASREDALAGAGLGE